MVQPGLPHRPYKEDVTGHVGLGACNLRLTRGWRPWPGTFVARVASGFEGQWGEVCADLACSHTNLAPSITGDVTREHLGLHGPPERAAVESLVKKKDPALLQLNLCPVPEAACSTCACIASSERCDGQAGSVRPGLMGSFSRVDLRCARATMGHLLLNLGSPILDLVKASSRDPQSIQHTASS